MNEQEVYKAAIDTFGVPKQVDMLIEEMSELTQALLKWRRGRIAAMENVHEEVADVEIVLAQIKIGLNPNKIAKIKAIKLARLEERIKNHE